MCGVFLFRFFQDRRTQDWICLNWIFPFRLFLFRFGWSGLFQDRVLDGSKLSVGITDTLPDHITLFLQLPYPGANAVHAILADTGKALHGVVPILRQRQHKGEQALRFQGKVGVPQMVV